MHSYLINLFSKPALLIEIRRKCNLQFWNTFAWSSEWKAYPTQPCILSYYPLHTFFLFYCTVFILFSESLIHRSFDNLCLKFIGLGLTIASLDGWFKMLSWSQ